MGCSRLPEIQRGTTGLYHGDSYDTRFVSGFSFVYLLEAFNNLLREHPTIMCSSLIFLGASLSGRQIGHLGSSGPQRTEFRYPRTAIVGHQNSNYNELCWVRLGRMLLQLTSIMTNTASDFDHEFIVVIDVDPRTQLVATVRLLYTH
jgi:hypothetical protein